jgi:Secretion system C-terminal sorting domain
MKLNKACILFFILFAFTCKAQWSSCGQGFQYPPKAMFNDTISKKLYVSGFGQYVDGKLAKNIASWDGQRWDTLAEGARFTFDEFLIRHKNKLYLQQAVGDNLDSTRIYTWDFNTKKWDSLPNGLLYGSIKTAVEYNGDLILVGNFNIIGGVPVHNIARFDGTNFYPVGYPTFSIYIRSVEVYKNEIYIGGAFNDTLLYGIAKWNGSQWKDVAGGFRGANEEVTKLKVYKNRLYAGGAWYGTKNEYMPSLAAWDGTKWNDVGGIRYNNFPWGVVYNMFELNNKLHVCGNFEQAGTIQATSMAVWDDTVWCAVNADFKGLVWVANTFQNTIYVSEREFIDNDSIKLLGYYTGSNYMGLCSKKPDVPYVGNSELSLFPNPFTNDVTLLISQNFTLNDTKINITNSLGQLLFTINPSSYNQLLNLSSLSSGMYYVLVQDGSKKSTIKIVKQ